MNPEAANVNAASAFPRCQKHTRNGRCRLPVTDSSATFCAEHARLQEKQRAKEDVCSILTANLTEFKSAEPINGFLSRLLLLQAQDRIPPRRAAVMAYTCSLLLRTLPAIDREHQERAPEAADPPKIFIGMPRPERFPYDPNSVLVWEDSLPLGSPNSGKDAPK